VPASVTDTGWLSTIPTDRPVLVLAEGLTMYLTGSAQQCNEFCSFVILNGRAVSGHAQRQVCLNDGVPSAARR
jgi:O-methyltransferase involved in polyketide biosynthesis